MARVGDCPWLVGNPRHDRPLRIRAAVSDLQREYLLFAKFFNIV